MDIRESIIQEVIAALEDCVTEDVINVAQDVLVIELNGNITLVCMQNTWGLVNVPLEINSNTIMYR